MVRQWKPLMRMNNKVMITINPEPVHLEFDELVHDLTVIAWEYDLNEVLMMTKSEFKVFIRRRVAHYRSWNFDGREGPYYLTDEEQIQFDATKEAIKAKVLKNFPEFETEAQMPETFQEANA